MEIVAGAVTYSAEKSNIPLRQVMSVLDLIINEQCTVPFIARYRKEATEGIDDTQLRQLAERLYYIRELDQLRASGASAAAIAEKTTEATKMKEWSKNEFFVILMTYVEILPVGLIVTLIASLILKRKNTQLKTAAV